MENELNTSKVIPVIPSKVDKEEKMLILVIILTGAICLLLSICGYFIGVRSVTIEYDQLNMRMDNQRININSSEDKIIVLEKKQNIILETMINEGLITIINPNQSQDVKQGQPADTETTEDEVVD